MTFPFPDSGCYAFALFQSHMRIMLAIPVLHHYAVTSYLFKSKLFAAVDEDEGDTCGRRTEDNGGMAMTVPSESTHIKATVKSEVRVRNNSGVVDSRPTTSSSGKTNDVTSGMDEKAFSQKLPSQSPHELSDESTGSDQDDMDLEDLIVQDECSSTEEEEELIPRRRCFSESDIRHKSENEAVRVERAYSASPYKYKRRDPIICAESIELECFMQRAHFFLSRSCHENIRLAKERSFWTTSRHVEESLGDSFMKAPAVILIFLENGADHFAGFAKMCSKALYRGQPALRWKEFSGGGNIKLQWISRCSLPIAATKHLRNSLNHGKAVYAGVDGSKIQRATGQRLCSLFPIDDGIDLSTLRAKKGRKKARRRCSSKRRGKSALPSLLDKPISYSQFERARRNLTARERWESDALSFIYSSTFVYKGPPRHKMTFEDMLRQQLYRPMPLMDLPLRYPLPARHHSHSRKDREGDRGREHDRERERMRRSPPPRHRSPVHNAHSHRRSSSRRLSRSRRSSQERRVAKRKRHAERTPPRRKDSSRRDDNGRVHLRSSSSSDLREKKRYRCSRHGSEERNTKHRK
uniref:YTH domain-containing protein n=3 Tax=Parascaris univalens TaxID=6257 RepID=A0A914ZI20_PARUN